MLVSGPQWRIIISGLAPFLLGTNHFVSPCPLFTNLTSFSFTATTPINLQLIFTTIYPIATLAAACPRSPTPTSHRPELQSSYFSRDRGRWLWGLHRASPFRSHANTSGAI